MTSQALTTTQPAAVGVSTSSVRDVTPVPSAGKSVAAMFKAGPHVSDPIPGGPLKGCSRALVDTVKATVAKGADDNQLFMFLNQAMTYNLDPLRKEIWCIDMGGQWMIAPSRDGYLRMAQRHPNFDQITSGVVRKGDDYKIDTVNGNVVHLVQGMGAADRPILGAWCIVKTRDGKRYAHQVLFSEVNRGNNVWKANPAQMTEKAVQSQTLRKANLVSDLYVSDRVWESIETDDMRGAILMDPTQAVYEGGFAVGAVIADRPAPALLDNGITDIPVPQNNGQPAADPELDRQRALDALGGIVTAAAKATKTPGKSVPPLVRALVWNRYGVEDVRALNAEQIASLSQALTADPAQLIPAAPASEAVAVVEADDDIPPFDAPVGEIDADEAARILAREQAEAEGGAQ